jgi:hypothetical protein
LKTRFQNIPHSSSTLTLTGFAGGDGWQGGTDEWWAIDYDIDWTENLIIGGYHDGQFRTDFHVVPNVWYQVAVSYSEKVRGFIDGSKLLEIDYPGLPQFINPTSWIGDCQGGSIMDRSMG